MKFCTLCRTHHLPHFKICPGEHFCSYLNNYPFKTTAYNRSLPPSRIFMCMCVFVWEREGWGGRGRGKWREGGREREREIETETHTQRILNVKFINGWLCQTDWTDHLLAWSFSCYLTVIPGGEIIYQFYYLSICEGLLCIQYYSRQYCILKNIMKQNSCSQILVLL